eukprot:9016350-Pyramimonas_sp.AAC.2
MAKCRQHVTVPCDAVHHPPARDAVTLASSLLGVVHTVDIQGNWNWKGVPLAERLLNKRVLFVRWNVQNAFCAIISRRPEQCERVRGFFAFVHKGFIR